jgi:multiple sugar transport system ATP-binding protein
MATVTFEDATRVYPGSSSPALDHLNLQIGDGEFLVLVGPSGSGKSTALRMLAGLEPVNSGRIFIGDRDVTDLPSRDRDIAMVFQSYALYPLMDVKDNMGFALEIEGVDKQEIRRRVEETARVLNLDTFLDRKPKALSGGQRQRVAMGRSIIRDPQVFLMDEPLSNLDAKLRVQTRTQITALQRRLGVTTVYVTHDQVEALVMGHRIAVLKDGVLQQVGTPNDVYDRPVNVFVAGFIGSPAMNLFDLTMADGGVHFGDLFYALDGAVPAGAGGRLTLGIRPEDLETAEHGLPVEVTVVENQGADAYVHARIVGDVAAAPAPSVRGEDGFLDGALDVVMRASARRPPALGQTIRLAPTSVENVHVFDSTSGRRLEARATPATAATAATRG